MAMHKDLTKRTTLLDESPPFVPDPPELMTVLLEVPPGEGIPPHRHSGPLSAYILEGEMIFELEGQPERLVRAGEAVFEPGGDVIHYQTTNNRPDMWLRFLATMIMVPGQPMQTMVSDEELEQRRDRRAPRPS
jgi:quercetin dioxygenase-like cupin family protein